jgi:hypothetical protein
LPGRAVKELLTLTARIYFEFLINSVYINNKSFIGRIKMSNEKDEVIEMIRQLPDTSTVDDIMEELYFRMQVDHGIKELNEGKGISHKEVCNRLSRWLKK